MAQTQRRDNAARVNSQIRVPQVRLIGPDGSQIGVVETREAMRMANQEHDLDLVEVAPTARPPVCKIMDYGKYFYEQNKKQRESRKKHHTTQLKEIKFRPKVSEHDYAFKLRHAREFIGHRDKVKFTVAFRGRENVHKDLGEAILERATQDLTDVASVEIPIRQEGRTVVMTLAPK
jgi:translation initiation factor IF-3